MENLENDQKVSSEKVKSVNPYKGVAGGDPRFRDANKKNRVKVSFVCKICGNNKTDLVTEGKVRRDIPCVDCRNAEGLVKAAEKKRKSEIFWAEYHRKEWAKPLRSEEERDALLVEFADSPKHDCDSCGKNFFIYYSNLPFASDRYDKKGAIGTVQHCLDPFDIEIHDKKNLRWLCNGCYKNIADDI